MASIVIVLTTGTTFTAPSDWTSSNNSIYLIGGGGASSGCAVSSTKSAAGAGGVRTDLTVGTSGTGNLTVNNSVKSTKNLDVTGNVTAGNLTVLGNIKYIMANYQNWNGNVTTISSALDQIAARLKAAGF